MVTCNFTTRHLLRGHYGPLLQKLHGCFIIIRRTRDVTCHNHTTVLRYRENQQITWSILFADFVEYSVLKATQNSTHTQGILQAIKGWCLATTYITPWKTSKKRNIHRQWIHIKVRKLKSEIRPQYWATNMHWHYENYCTWLSKIFEKWWQIRSSQRTLK